MRKSFILAIIIFNCVNAELIDIISNFDFNQYPAKLNKLKKEYQVRQFWPDEYKKLNGFKHKAKKVIMINNCFDKNYLKTFSSDQLIFIGLEPTKPNSDIIETASLLFSIVENSVDNEKIFKLHTPYLMPMLNKSTSFETKQLCTLVTRHWTKERRQIVEFFSSKPKGDFSFYGFTVPENLPGKKNYKGKIPGYHSGITKQKVLSKYKFCICFENTQKDGYISEKIFNCFAAGCIPIYLGDPNIEKYIPKSCFVDYRDFEDNEELYEYMINLKEQEFNQYVANIEEFIKSENAQIFSPKYFNKMIYKAVSN